MPVNFIVDDQNAELQYLCPVTEEAISGAYFNKTWTTTASDQCRDGWFQYTFYGTGVEIVAFSPTPQNYSVKIDNSQWVTKHSRGAFQSPPLSDAQHTISYAPGMLVNPILDYIVVEAGTSTSLQNSTIIVDDADPELLYSGSWSTETPASTANDFSTASFRNTIHWSTTAGDTFQYNFSGKSAIRPETSQYTHLMFTYAGSSIAVFGSFANISAGHNFSATYSLDGVPTVASIPDGTLDGLPLTCLFSANTMPAGNHTLSVDITHMSPPLAIGFDFLTFNASFASLDQMPGYVAFSSSSHMKRIAAVVGGVLGGVAFILAVLFVVLLQKRRRKRRVGKATGIRQRWSELK